MTEMHTRSASQAGRMRALAWALAGLQIAGRWVDVRDPEVLASLQA